jgi:hypothetical protein
MKYERSLPSSQKSVIGLRSEPLEFTLHPKSYIFCSASIPFCNLRPHFPYGLSLNFGNKVQNCYFFMSIAWRADLIFLHLIILSLLVIEYKLSCSSFCIFSMLLVLPFFNSKYSPQHFILKYSQFVALIYSAGPKQTLMKQRQTAICIFTLSRDSRASDVRQIEIHTAEPLVPDLSPFEV